MFGQDLGFVSDILMRALQAVILEIRTATRGQESKLAVELGLGPGHHQHE